MHRNLTVQTLIFSLLCSVACSFVNAADVPGPAALEQLGLELRWTNQAVLDVRRDVIVHVSNDEELVFVQSAAGILTAFDAENGRRLWSQQTGRSDEPAMAAVSNRNLVIVVAGPVMYGYNKFSGMPLIEFRLPRQPSASPVMGDDVVYVPLAGGALYAYSTNVLEHKFRYGALPDTVAIPHMWRFICNEEIVYPPVDGLEAVAFVSEAANLHSVNTTGLAIGRSRFQLMLKAPATAPAVIADNRTSSSVIVLTGDHRVFSIDLITGDVEWTYPMGRPMTSAPIVVEDDVYVATSDGVLTRFSRDSNSPDWGRPIEIPQYRAPLLIGAGMEDAEIPLPLQAPLKLSGQGVRITTVVPDSAAAQAGLQAGDLLVSVNQIPTISVDVAREVLESLPLRVERPFAVIRVDSGVRLQDVEFTRPLSVPQGAPLETGVVISGVVRDSAADASDLRPDDVLLKIGDVEIDSVETAQRTLAAAAPGTVAVQLLRDGQVVASDLPLRFEQNQIPGVTAGEVLLQKLKLRIPVRKWQVGGIRTLSAVGRFSVFGIDQTNRLVAFDEKTSVIRGRISVQPYGLLHRNSATDRIYLVSSTGEVVCLREIGPTVRLPDLSALSYHAVVTKVHLNPGDPIEATGTVVCTVEFPDGTVHDVSSDRKGTVRSIYVAEGDEVSVDDALLLIADDQFATYHQRPAQQPIDVQLQDPNAAPAP
ncbi:MAG: PQQ-binding-like beta-propeller repeat protein [Fuerstiella sp.]